MLTVVEQDPAAVRLRARRGRVFVALAVDPPNRRIAPPAFGAGAEHVELTLELVGIPEVIGIQKRDPSSPGRAQPDIPEARRIGTVPVLDHPEPGIGECANIRARSIGGAVIHHDQFEVGEGL